MDILAGAVIEAKLIVAGKKLVLRSIAARRQYRVAAMIGKFETDDIALAVAAVLPARADFIFLASRGQLDIIGDLARGGIFIGSGDGRLGPDFAEA